MFLQMPAKQAKTYLDRGGKEFIPEKPKKRTVKSKK